MTTNTDFLRFVDASPSPFHAVANVAGRLTAAGFTEVDEADPFPRRGRHYIVRGGSLVAWAAPEDVPPTTGFRIIGAHTDSPNLRLKPRPDIGRAGAVQLGVEVYGGVLFNSWLDRDLGLSGRIAVRGTDGVVEQLVHVNRAVLRIPQLAIHLDRDVNERGLQLNPQQHLVPMWALGSPEPDGFRRFIAKELEVDADAVVAWDVMLHDVTPAAVIGRDHDLISAPRLDNLCSCWAATNALVSAVDDNEPDLIAVVCLFDHEEVGSMSDRGASSEMLPAVLERIVLAAGGDRDAWHRALAASVCVSADNAHATNPNYAERHDPAHVIALNGGPAVKLNANQRYASDAANTAVWIDACERAGVPVQLYVHRSDLPCGSTIGPLTAARLGVTTVDVGAPQLAMHAARELMGADDAAYLWRGLAAFLA